MSKEKNWEITLAKEFARRDNPSPLGAMLGKIISPLPDIKIELLNGHAIIEADKIYLSNAITNRLAIECTLKDFETASNTASNWEATGNKVSGLSTSGGGAATSLVNHSGTLSTLTSPSTKNDKENKEKGKMVLQTIFHLEEGMFVLVIPNVEEDKFFVVDVFNYAKEVDLSCQYYQK